MTPAQLNRAVARATGESVREIRRRGFSLVESFISDLDPEPNYLPQTIDWDELSLCRNVALSE